MPRNPGRPGSPLARLGAGTGEELLISGSRDVQLLQKLYKAHHPQFNRIHQNAGVFIYYVAYTVLGAFFIYTGIGVHNVWQNRATTLLLFWIYMAYMYLVPLARAENVGRLMAMTLVSAQIKHIRANLESELATQDLDLSESDWQDLISRPCRELITTLEILNDNWGTGMVYSMIFYMNLCFVMVCLSLSPTIHRVGIESGITWLDEFLLAFFVGNFFACLAGAIIVCVGPAQVSTECDDLKEKFNAVRISDLAGAHSQSQEIHSRLIILEKSMTQVNRPGPWCEDLGHRSEQKVPPNRRSQGCGHHGVSTSCHICSDDHGTRGSKHERVCY